MYPRNASSPPRIAVGPVVQISDGAVQTSGCSVVVRAEGGSETAGGGTVSYGASSGFVYYTPTQAETNYTAFAVVAYKSGCIPAGVTVVTTASSTAGQAVCADSQKVDVNTIKTQTVTATAGFSFDGLTTLIGRFTGITSLANWLRGLFRKDAMDATAKSEVNSGGGAYDESTDSQEAIRDTAPLGSAMRGTDGANTIAPDNAGIAAIKAKTDNLPANPAAVGSQMDLVNAPNATALAAIGAKVEAMVLDDGDATALLAAIAAKVEEFLVNEGDATATIAAIATACNAAIAAGTVGTNVAAVKAKTDNLPADPASNTQVNTRLAATAYTAPANADVAAIKAKTDNLPADPASNTQVNTRLAAADYTAPANADVAAIKAKTDNLPADPASNTQVNTRLAAADYTAPANADVAAIKAKTDNLPADPASDTTVNTRLAAEDYTPPDNAGIAAAGVAAAAAQAAATAAQAAAEDAADGVDALPTALSAAHGAGSWEGGAGGGGSGAYTVTVTVTDDAEDPQPLENAIVRYSSGIETYTRTTDVNGQCIFNLDAATWTVAATRSDYDYAGGTHVVAADSSKSKTIVMETRTIPAASDPDLCVCYGVTRTETGEREGEVDLTIELLTPASPTGQYRRTPITITSDANGDWSVDLASGLYRCQRTDGPTGWRQVTVPEAESYEFPSL